LDGGVSWQRRPDFTDHVRAIIVDRADPLTAYAVRDRFGGGHVFRTRDGGQHWIDISGSDPGPNLRLPDLPASSIVLEPRFTPNVLYVGNDSGVYISTDDGVTWSRFGIGLPNAQVADLKLNTTLNLLVAATHGRGVWQILLQ